MNSRAGVIALVALALGLGWYLLQPGQEAQTGSQVIQGSVVEPSAVDSKVAPVKPVDSEPFEGGEKRPEVSLAPPAPTAILPKVILVDEEGSVVPRAKVTVRPQDADARFAAFGGLGKPKLSEITTPDDRSLSMTSNEEGVVTWNAEKPGGWHCTAATGDLGGTAHINALDPAGEAMKRVRESKRPLVQRIVLTKFRDIRIKVIDAQREPIPNAIVIVLDPDANRFASNDWSTEYVEEFNSAFTDTNGKVHWRAYATGRSPLTSAKRLRFYVLRFGDTAVKEDWDWGGSRDELVITAHGLVQTHVSFSGASASKHKGDRRLIWQAGKPPRESYGRSSGGGLRSFSEVAESRMATWAASIPPEGRTISCFAQGASIGYLLKSGKENPQKGVWKVPNTSKAQWVIESGLAMATVRFQLLDESGEPAPLHGYWFGNTGFGRPGPKAVDDGHYEYVVTPNQSGTVELLDDPRASLFARNGLNRIPPKPVATLSWKALKPGQVIDIGKMVVPKAPVSAFGQVVDTEGNPIEGAHISFSLPNDDLHSWPFAKATSDKDGKFELRRKLTKVSELKVSASTQQARCEETVFPINQEMIIRLEAIGRLAGKIKCSASIKPEIKLELHGPSLKYPRSLFALPGGTFRSQPLKPGTYSFVVSVAGNETARFDGIQVTAGQDTKPAELQELHVAEGFEFATVKVLGPNGQPLRHAQVTPLYGPDTDSFVFDGREDCNGLGVAKVLIRKTPQLRIKVGGPLGLRRGGMDIEPQVIENPTFPLSVKLRSYPNITLNFDPPLPLETHSKLRVLLSSRRSPEELAAPPCVRVVDASTKGPGVSRSDGLGSGSQPQAGAPMGAELQQMTLGLG